MPGLESANIPEEEREICGYILPLFAEYEIVPCLRLNSLLPMGSEGVGNRSFTFTHGSKFQTFYSEGTLGTLISLLRNSCTTDHVHFRGCILEHALYEVLASFCAVIITPN